MRKTKIVYTIGPASTNEKTLEQMILAGMTARMVSRFRPPVNILGLTSYERGNEKKYQTFRKMYKALYKKNTPYFENFPYVISEFGAGAGGKVLFNYEKCVFEEKEIRRNLNKQSKWVKNMFKEFAKQEDYVKNIKGAIWFSVNDYAYVNGKNEIMNYFELDDSVMPTIRQFKKGL